MTTIVGVWAGPSQRRSDASAAGSGTPAARVVAVGVAPCVHVVGAPGAADAPLASPIAASSERLTPLALVSVMGGAGGTATARVETNRGVAARPSHVADLCELATRPLRSSAVPLSSVLPVASVRAAEAPPAGEGRRLRLAAHEREGAVRGQGVGAAAGEPAPVHTSTGLGPVAVPAAHPKVVAPAAAGESAAALGAVAPAQPAAAPATPPPASSAAEAQRQLFRKAALQAHYGGDVDLDALAEPKRGAWAVLVVLGSLVALLFVGAALLSIEVTVKAPGALRAPNGLRSVESVLSGAVTEVLARAGDEVVAGQVVARLEETKLRSTLTLRERELELLEQDTLEASQADAAMLESATRALERQRAALQQRRQITGAQLRQRRAHLQNLKELVKYGAASAADELAVSESVQAASESMAQLGSQVAQLELSMADRQREWQQRDLERRAALSRASAAVEEAVSLLELVEIRAPADGRIESLLTSPGAVVTAGEILAQIVPKDAPRSIVAFLPSRETAFVRLGTEANVEVESLPVNEFGMARARVTRISTDIAKAEEIELAFGEALPGSFVRVELSLESDGTQHAMAPHLRSGERVLVRLHRRERRILSLLFEFVRKWLGQ